MENNKIEVSTQDIQETEEALRQAIEVTELAYNQFLTSLKPLTSVQMYRVIEAVLPFPQLKAVHPKREAEKIAIAAGMTFMNAKTELAKLSYQFDILTDNVVAPDNGGDNNE